MLESIAVYTVLFFIMFLCGDVSARRQKKYVLAGGTNVSKVPFLKPEMVALFFSFAFVFGCRWGVGRDFYRYLEAYTGAVPERFEFLFQTISKILQGCGAHFSIYFGVWALLDIFLLYYALRDYRYLFPYVAFFLIFGSYYLPMMNAMRQYIAGLIFLNSIRYIERGQFKKFMICYVLAIMFHKLSIILFVFYPLLRRKDDWFKRITPQIIMFVIAAYIGMHGEILLRWIEVPFSWVAEAMGYERYSFELLGTERYDRTRFGNNTGLGIWVKILLTMPIIFKNRQLKAYYNSSYFNMLYTLYFIGVITSLLFEGSIILNRVAMFFAIYQLIMYSMFVHYCFSKKSNNYNILGLMYLLLQIPLFLNMISNPNSTTPYLFFWQHAS